MEKARKEADANAERLKEAERQAAQVQKARQDGDLSAAEGKKQLEKLRAEQEAAASKERAAIEKMKSEQQAQAERERAAVAKFKAEQEALIEKEREAIAQMKAQQEEASNKAKYEVAPSEVTPSESSDPAAVTELIAPSPVELPNTPPAGSQKEESSPFGALVSFSCLRHMYNVLYIEHAAQLNQLLRMTYNLQGVISW